MDLEKKRRHVLEAHDTEGNDTENHVLEAHDTEGNDTGDVDFEELKNSSEINKRQGAYLPHWTADGSTYHVRFSLYDAIPVDVKHSLLEERQRIQELVNVKGEDLSTWSKERLLRLHSKKVERFLDNGNGSCLLADEAVAKIVADALKFFEGDRYFLFAWCIMPNHVHVVVNPVNGHKLHKILHSWKSYTANRANEYLRRNGPFWQTEYFDRIIRNSDNLERTIVYVFTNPDKAGLAGHRWRWCCRIN